MWRNSCLRYGNCIMEILMKAWSFFGTKMKDTEIMMTEKDFDLREIQCIMYDTYYKRWAY